MLTPNQAPEVAGDRLALRRHPALFQVLGSATTRMTAYASGSQIENGNANRDDRESRDGIVTIAQGGSCR